MFRLSLRSLLGLALVVVNVGLTAIVAAFTYQAAHDAMVDQALRSVGSVAQSRERALTGMLGRRQRRLDGFLASLQSLCGERNPSGGFGFEDQCMRAAVGGLHRSELATTTELKYRERRLVRFGLPPGVSPPMPGALVRIEARGGTGRYSMRAERGALAVEISFDLEDINAIFADQAGIESNGEAFLTDAAGYRLTSAATATANAFPVEMSPIKQCLNGVGEATTTTDYRGVDVISGLRPTSLAGDGCIVANVTYADATLPVRRLGSLLVYAAVLIGVFGIAVSFVVAGLVTRPIKRLALAARALADGDLGAPVPVTGPSEVRQLGRTLSHMAASIKDLVGREREARLHAESASRTKDEFLATLSHELRTPLNAILGWASILMRTDHDRSRVSHAVRVIERNARVQSQMIEGLDVSRIVTGRSRLNVIEVPAASVIDAALEAVRPTAEAKGVALRRQIELGSSTIGADPRRLQQIIWNLLSNGVKFTPAGGSVDITARSTTTGIELVVSDTGCGIRSDFLPYVFDRFRQGDSSTTRSHGGLGLGLTIVRDLVQLHGGTVSADSPGEGRGTTFVVRLPSRAPSKTTEVAPAADGRPHRLSGAKVLVVDDDPDARDVLKTILEDAGARVTTSASASETRAIFNKTHPDVLVADIGMPEEDGHSLIQSIRLLEGAQTHVPAIALTAHTRSEDVEQALASGFQMHVAKPIDSIRIVAAIAELYEGSPN